MHIVTMNINIVYKTHNIGINKHCKTIGLANTILY